MAKITLGIIAERLEQIHKHNIEDHEEMKAGIKHTNGDVRDLKIWRAKAQGALIVLSIIVSGILIPLVFKYLSISLFN